VSVRDVYGDTASPIRILRGSYAGEGGVTAKDLFGNLVDFEALARQPLTHAKRKRMPTVPHGHYFTPGTGPAGETCGSCKHLTRRHFSKAYLKCGLNESKWTGGPGSDVRAKDAACKYWTAP
jgi:hypothetical protein